MSFLEELNQPTPLQAQQERETEEKRFYKQDIDWKSNTSSQLSERNSLSGVESEGDEQLTELAANEQNPFGTKPECEVTQPVSESIVPKVAVTKVSPQPTKLQEQPNTRTNTEGTFGTDTEGNVKKEQHRHQTGWTSDQ